jgi:uncharacterized protein YkwD
MNFIVILAFLASSVVIANPFKRQYATTEYEYLGPVVAVTLSGNPSLPSTTKDASGNGWADWGEHGSSQSTLTITLTTSSTGISTTAEETSSTTEASASSTSASSSSASFSSSSSSSSTVAESYSSTSTSPSSTPAQTKAVSDYTKGILDQHNSHRENASVSALTWSDDLAAISQQIAETCVYKHNTSAGPGDYGQNIGAGASPGEVPALITNLMYNGEIELYPGYGSEPDMSNFDAWGHYSQIVWNSTAEVGCATLYCSNGLANTAPNITPYFTVCNYRPTGEYSDPWTFNLRLMLDRQYSWCICRKCIRTKGHADGSRLTRRCAGRPPESYTGIQSTPPFTSLRQRFGLELSLTSTDFGKEIWFLCAASQLFRNTRQCVVFWVEICPGARS